MANYDNKLGEWFKLVEKQEQELKAKKKPGASQSKPHGERDNIVQNAREVSEVEVKQQVKDSPASSVATADTSEVAADTSVVDSAGSDGGIRVVDSAEASDSAGTETASRHEADMQVRGTAEDTEDPGPSLFDTTDVPGPKVDDFFAYIERRKGSAVPDERESESPQRPDESSTYQSSLGIGEGTGEPRPITTPPVQEMETGKAEAQSAPEEADPKSSAAAEPAAPESAPAEIEAPKSLQESDVQEKWDRLPEHLKALFGEPKREVAQNSYKTFKESRDELIQRLLDPVISLEEAARVLNVCPTTVRRYTNRGLLKHHRTPGNQRRFKLSDVLAFLESSSRTSRKVRGDSTQGTSDSA